MRKTTTTLQVQHDGVRYDVVYDICEDCLLAEIGAMLNAGLDTRRFGAGDGAFSIHAQPAASAAPAVNGTEAA